MRLVYNGTNDEVKVGDEVSMRDGEDVTISYFREPHKAASSGKVTVETADGPREYYVSGIGAGWVEREDQNWTPPENAPHDKPVKKKIEHRLMELLRERGYEPTISRGANGFWIIDFPYESDNGEMCMWHMKSDDLLCDQWWLV